MRAAALAAALMLPACGGDDSGDDVGSDTSTTTTTAAATTTTEAPPPEEDGPDPVGEAEHGEVTSPDGFPGDRGEVALLVDVRAAARPGFDRIVFDFDAEEAPSYRVAPLDPPVRQDFSGNEMEVAGTAFLEVRFDPAAGFDTLSEDARPTYTGPDRITVNGSVVTEIVKLGDFEAQVAWAVGLTEEAPFAVGVLEDPTRIVLDVVEPDEEDS